VRLNMGTQTRHSVSMYRARELAVLAALIACASCGRGGHPASESTTISPSHSTTKSLPSAESPAAEAACNGPGSRQLVGADAVLRGAFQSSGPNIVRWEASGEIYGPVGTGPPPPRAESRFARAHATDQTVFVCYFDGEFTASHPMPPGAETVPPQYNRAMVYVSSSGSADFYGIGYHDTEGYPDMAIEAPPSSR